MEVNAIINWTCQFPPQGLLGVIFVYYPNCNRTLSDLANRADPNQMSLSEASDLGLHCSPTARKKNTAKPIWVSFTLYLSGL